MKNKPINHQKKWTIGNLIELGELLSKEIKLSDIAIKLGRSEISIKKKIPAANKFLKDSEILKKARESILPSIRRTINESQPLNSRMKEHIKQLMLPQSIENIQLQIRRINSLYAIEAANLARIHLPKLNYYEDLMRPIQQMLKNITLSQKHYSDLLEQFKIPELVFKKFDKSWLDDIGKINTNQQEFIRNTLKPILESIGQLNFSSYTYKEIALSANFNNPFKNLLFCDFDQISKNYKLFVESIASTDNIFQLPKISIPWSNDTMVLNGNLIRSLYDSEDNIESNIQDHITPEFYYPEHTLRKLVSIDPSFEKIYFGIIQSFTGTNVNCTRHVLVDLRTIWEQVFSLLAPTKLTLQWLSEKQLKNEEFIVNEQPTRKARVYFICRDIYSKELRDLVDSNARMILKLYAIFQRLHDPNFDVNRHKLKAVFQCSNSCLYFLLTL